MATRRIVDKKEIEKHRDNLNPKFTDKQDLDKILESLEDKPAWCAEDLEMSPAYNRGLNICMDCHRVYWVTRKHGAVKVVAHGRLYEGAYCDGCGYFLAVSATKS